MPSLPFFDDTAPAPTRVPSVEIEIGGGGGGDSFGGLADAAASLLGGAAAPSWPDYLVELTLRQGFAPAVDYADLLVAQTPAAPAAAIGDSARIRMGAAAAFEDVFNGSIVAVERRSDGLRRYRLGNAGYSLANSRLNQAVTQMSVADAIAFAIETTGAPMTNRVSGSDATLSQYVFDDSRSVWQHVAKLAELRGFDLWVDSAGELQLADQLEQGDTVQSFTFGSDVLSLNLWQRSPHSGAIVAFGGGHADDGFTLRKQGGPNRSTGGDGAPQRFYRDGVLQSQDDLAARVSSATLRGHRRTTACEVSVPGSNVLAPGSVIAITALPDGDGKFLILSAEHTFNRREGWRTQLTVSDAGNVPDLSGLLGALGGLL
jgi:prophage tail gpP-like protein